MYNGSKEWMRVDKLVCEEMNDTINGDECALLLNPNLK